MKHFSDDGCNLIPEYDYNMFHHKDEDTLSSLYDSTPIGGFSREELDTVDNFDDAGTIKHFQD